MDAVVTALEKAKWSVQNVEKKERRRNPTAPFHYQQIATGCRAPVGLQRAPAPWVVAQRLYEGIELGSEGAVGLITYMRTDSTRVSPDAIAEARNWIEQNHGKDYLPAAPNAFKARRTRRTHTRLSAPAAFAHHPEEIKRYLQ